MGEASIGARLREARTERGLSQRELARRVEVSASLISQVEAGQTQPSVTTLYAIVSELGASLDEIFGHEPRAAAAAAPPAADTPATPPAVPDPEVGSTTAGIVTHPGDWAATARVLGRRAVVQSPEERATIHLEAGVTWERLDPGLASDVDFMLVTYEPGGSSSRDGTLMRHGGIECAYVLEGSLTVQVGFDVEHLEAGDSFGFNSSIPHRLRNEGDTMMRAVWMVVHG